VTPRLTYRPSLDGLRAVAVLAVMLYHGQVVWLHGGFLGVDVFFTLSGYLITYLLLVEWRTWGSIDLRRFWLRRARRLLPALFVVLVAVAVYAAVAISPDRLHRVRGDAIATLLYVANWRFAATGQSYFDQFAEPSPLLHAWSLGIEEQFYWVFPVLLLGWLHLRRSTRGLMTALLLGAAASSLWMAHLYRPGADPSRIYYGTDTRATELLVGAALAVWSVRRAVRQERGGARQRPGPRLLDRPVVTAALGTVGLVGLVVAFTRMSENSAFTYRGGLVVVSLLTAMVLLATERPGPVTSALGGQPVRLIGMISYGLYLWHWPTYLALTPDRTHLDGLALLTLRLAVTGALATASFVLVERPIRSGALRRRLLPGTRRGLVTASTVLVVSAIMAGTAGAAAPPSVERSGTYETRVVTPAAGQTSVLLAGDSPGRFLGWYFPKDEHADIALSTTTVIGCGLPPQRLVVKGVESAPQPQCDEWPSEFARAAGAVHPDLVVVSTGAWEVFDHVVDGKVLKVGTAAYEAELLRQYDRAIAALAGTRTKVALLDVPCFRQASWVVSGVDLAPDHNDPGRQEWLNTVLAKVAARHPGQVSVLDLRSFLCPGGRYVDSLRGVRVRPDGVHVGAPGGQLVWSWLAPQLQELLTNPSAPRAFLFGDSMALNLRANFPRSESRLRVDGATLLGCGLAPDAISYRGTAKRLPPECVSFAQSWPRDVSGSPPDVGLVMVGEQQQWDTVVDGRTLRFGSDAFARHLDAVLDAAVAPFRAAGVPVAVSTVPCHHVPDPGTIPDAKVINDDARVAWLHDHVVDYGQQQGVAVVDLDRFLCSGGYQEQLGGVRLRSDGMHFTREGAAYVWGWLADQLLAVRSGAQSSS
jgi:peptidoglycan/LPS O-acetylase OafA/YrhL